MSKPHMSHSLWLSPSDASDRESELSFSELLEITTCTTSDYKTTDSYGSLNRFGNENKPISGLAMTTLRC